MKYSMCLSVLVHLGLLLFVFYNYSALSSKSPSRIKPAMVEITLSAPQGETIIPSGGVDQGVQCKKWYGGIGISLSGFLITEVVEGYPAGEAGLLVGDVVMSRVEIRGEPGTQILLSIKRSHNMLQFTIIRQKICYN